MRLKGDENLVLLFAVKWHLEKTRFQCQKCLYLGQNISVWLVIRICDIVLMKYFDKISVI